MSNPPEHFPDPLSEGLRDAVGRATALLSTAAQWSILAMEIRERRRAGQAVTATQRENAEAAAGRVRRATGTVEWQRALDDTWLHEAPTGDMVTAWTAARIRLPDDEGALNAARRLEDALAQREPRAMDLFHRLIDAPYPPEEAMRQAATWFAWDGPQPSATDRDRAVADGLLAASAGKSVRPDTVPPAERQDLRDLLLDVLPDHGPAAIRDPAWPALAIVLSRAEERGEDVRRSLAHVVNARGLDGAESVAQVLTWRLHRHDETQSAPQNSNPVPTPTTTDPLLSDPPVASTPTTPPPRQAAPPSSRPADNVADAIEEQAAEAARLAGLASPHPISQALQPPPQQASPAVVPGKPQLNLGSAKQRGPVPRPRP